MLNLFILEDFRLIPILVIITLMIVIYRHISGKFKENTRTSLDTSFNNSKKINSKKDDLTRQISFSRKYYDAKQKRGSKGSLKEYRENLLVELDNYNISKFSSFGLPNDIEFMVQSLNVLGLLEEEIFLKLCQFIKSKSIFVGENLSADNDLINVNDNLFVVQTGKIEVLVTDSNFKVSCIKTANKGDSIYSLLNVLDRLTSNKPLFSNLNISINALEDSVLLILPIDQLKNVIQKYPKSLMQVIKIIGIRLHRVMISTLRNYFGLNKELFAKKIFVDSKKENNNKSLKTNSNYEAKPLCSNNLITDSYILISELDNLFNSSKSCFVNSISTSSDVVNNKEQFTDYLNNSQKVKDFCRLENKWCDYCNELRELEKQNIISSDNKFSTSTHSKGLNKLSKNNIEGQEAITCLNCSICNSLIHFSNLLGLSLAYILRYVKIEYLKSDYVINEQGCFIEALYYIVEGKIALENKTKTVDESINYMNLGELIGALSILTDEPSMFTFKTHSNVTLFKIDKLDLIKICRENKQVMINIGHSVISCLSLFLRQVDFALDWIQLEANQVLYNLDEEADSAFIVLSGRLRATTPMEKTNSQATRMEEFGRNEIIGLEETLTGEYKRSSTLVAIRDSELARLPDGLISFIKRKYPQTVTQLVQSLGQRILSNLPREENIFSMLTKHPGKTTNRLKLKNSISTIALFAGSSKVPLNDFALELHYALDKIGSTLLLNNKMVQQKLNISSFDSVNYYRLSPWLSQQEDHYSHILYQCEVAMTPWTQKCIRQADCILVICMAEDTSVVNKSELQLSRMSTRASKYLILLHKDIDINYKPKNTINWLNKRPWCSKHFHVRFFEDKLCHKCSNKEQPKINSKNNISNVIDGSINRVYLNSLTENKNTNINILDDKNEKISNDSSGKNNKLSLTIGEKKFSNKNVLININNLCLNKNSEFSNQTQNGASNYPKKKILFQSFKSPAKILNPNLCNEKKNTSRNIPTKYIHSHNDNNFNNNNVNINNKINISFNNNIKQNISTSSGNKCKSSTNKNQPIDNIINQNKTGNLSNKYNSNDEFSSIKKNPNETKSNSLNPLTNEHIQKSLNKIKSNSLNPLTTEHIQKSPNELKLNNSLNPLTNEHIQKNLNEAKSNIISLNLLTTKRIQKSPSELKPNNRLNPLTLTEHIPDNDNNNPSKIIFDPLNDKQMVNDSNSINNHSKRNDGDIFRLARILTNTAVGLVFGGGAARGCSHAGVIKAFLEANIPIDVVGGTSIGALVSALWALQTDFEKFHEKFRSWALNYMGSLYMLLSDLTYPMTALFSGSNFNRSLEQILGTHVDIEDLWIPFFCVSTDITHSKARVHSQGSLWRYVRSSMSLAGYLPPLCDPIDGNLLLDGVYTNNLPADVMRDEMLGVRSIIAVDVGRETLTNYTNYGDALSGWKVIATKFLPFLNTMQVPNFAEVQARLGYVVCERQLEQVKSGEFCEYLRPPIDKYKPMQFKKFDEIFNVGYNYTKELILDWKNSGKLTSTSLFR